MKKAIIMTTMSILLLTGCRGEVPEPTLSSEGIENIIYEDIIYEDIIYEDIID